MLAQLARPPELKRWALVLVGLVNLICEEV